jgi:hypothetical protein
MLPTCMAMSTSFIFLAAPEQENARMAAEDKVEGWSPPTTWTLSHTHECVGRTPEDALEVTQLEEERRKARPLEGQCEPALPVVHWAVPVLC